MAIPSTTLNQVEILFVGYFGRAGDPAGVSFWTQALNDGTATFQSIAGLFGTSPEAKLKFPYLASPLVTDPTVFVQQVYQNLFNRLPDAAGQTFWVNYLNANNGNPTAVGNFIATVIQSAAAGGVDNTTLQNKADVAADFTEQVSNAGLPFNDAAAVQSSAELALVTADPATVAAAKAATLAFIAEEQLPNPDLTAGVDTGPAFTATVAGVTFDATPAANPPLGVSNTLNAGDNLQDTVGDGILKLFLVADSSGLANPALATAVTMNGLATANITNTSGGTGGFSGNITGLTTANILGGTNGNVLLGVASLGLNTALANLDIATGVDQNVTAWFDPAALAGDDNSINIGLHGSNQTIDLLVTGAATNGYETANINSVGGPNILDLDVDTTTLATINVTGDQNLTMDDASTALNLANLVTFDGTAATGNLDISFPGAGDVVVDGGSGNDSFTFPAGNGAGAVTVRGNAGDDTFTFLTTNGGTSTFTGNDNANGGAGTNRLRIQADTGAILPGDGTTTGVIANIATIVHFANVDVDGALTANMAFSGSATVLELSADYDNNDVAVTNLVTAKSVLFSGDDIDDMDLDAATLLGQVNLTMAQTATGGTQSIDDLDLVVGNLLNLTSAGNATTNLIEDVSGVNAHVSIFGSHQLNFGFLAANAKATNAGNAYDFDTGIVDAAAHTGALLVGLDTGKQQVALGTGNDLVHIWTAGNDGNAKLIQLGTLAGGGSDIVELHDVFDDATDSIVPSTLANINYTRIEGFNVANDIIRIDAGAGAFEVNIEETNATGVFNPPAIFNYLPGTSPALGGLFIDMIKVDVPIGAFSTPDTLFNAAIGANNIAVNAPDGVLFGVYSNDFQSMVLFVIDGPGATITAADDVDVLAVVGMNFADYQTFGTNGSLVFT